MTCASRRCASGAYSSPRSSACMQARGILLRALVHNLLVGRSMPAIAAVATAHLQPGSLDAADAASVLTQAVTARVSADAAAVAVMRMVLIAAQSHSTRGSHRHDEVSFEDPKQPRSPCLRESNASSAFESYRTSPSCVIKLAAARCIFRNVVPHHH